MLQSKIDRINELARKAKQGALTEAELAERKTLREEYLAEIRRSVQSQLDSVVVEYEDGKREKLTKDALKPEVIARHSAVSEWPAEEEKRADVLKAEDAVQPDAPAKPE